MDLVGSGSLPGHHVAAARSVALAAVSGALRDGELETDVLDWADTGDGALITLPTTRVADVVDAAVAVDSVLVEHNTWHKPDVRLRMAVEIGPVGEGAGLHRGRVDTNRLLDAQAVKDLFARCVEQTSGATASALVISDKVINAVFSGDHTTRVRRSEFTPLRVVHKEFADKAWVRVPGVDASTLARLVEPPQEAASAPPVANTVYGAMHGVQAHTINGGVNLGGRR
ncbi:hypothetical protein [Actinokineospora bangkokensis]|uniref:Uncharacterized protein n=1 Tax=Actinokineospora bangkokensis TaxID=1193682 RepID=A0A1Q9LTU7_9PSEU|nr:hypothetical protein [Actinokineospora bangkokensis]OLR95433.1 hypothetical protein BJP25_06720 [Actinokineospora bangkokensis]